MAGEKEGKEKMGGVESNHQSTDLISRPCLCFCMYEGGVVDITPEKTVYDQNKTHEAEAPNQAGEEGKTISKMFDGFSDRG